ncbi:hypothetical protein RGU72_11565 [Undibacterium sp. 5I1]|uniref:hypothetical protein n=1 Tax=unclassified Undibacterium TaxID=2630295 RepID=UPI002AB4B765|nr:MULTISPECIES: hypothetical protein [unclassified Undibacterium]MDY7538895.1 hypothetical protein [Undibacterium sp. 5I1]MEB0231021.1 hypothetical protein [Undibacterium sp. 10I3]MEB0257796.1 hypothetical protein [Undibacterium sp. 5I1]
MSEENNTSLEQEWVVLQNNIEALERSCLLIKLCAVALFIATAVFNFSVAMIVGLLLLMCLQEAIVRTSQARLSNRILRIEAMMKQPPQEDFSAFQLHTEWLKERKGVVGLLMEYASQALRPTVAFPYVLLVVFSFALNWGQSPY